MWERKKEEEKRSMVGVTSHWGNRTERAQKAEISEEVSKSFTCGEEK